jgi:hypothetical protein
MRSNLPVHPNSSLRRLASMLTLVAASFVVGCESSDVAGPGGGSGGVAAVRISAVPLDANLHPGDDIQLSASVRDSRGNPLTGRTVTWSSDDTDIATVTQSGFVSILSRGQGSVIIRAEVDNVSGSRVLDIGGWVLLQEAASIRVSLEANVGSEGGPGRLPKVNLNCHTPTGDLALYVGFPFSTDGSGRVKYRVNGETEVSTPWDPAGTGPVFYPGQLVPFTQLLAKSDTLHFSTVKINEEWSAMTFIVRGLSEFLPTVTGAC